MSAGMVEVIAAHVVTDSGLTEDRDVYWRCSCGALRVTALAQVGDHIYDHAAHVAEELAKAGYGDVRKTRREPMQDAWEYGWAAGVLDATVPDRRKSSNPYGEFSANRLRGVAR